ncbi:MAG: CGNR zinc finger domain-containing protein [Thermomicrobiales bacterium]
MQHSDHDFSLDSGSTALDFANTIDPRRGSHPVDSLPDYPALLHFASASGVLDRTACDRLMAEAVERPYEANAVHAIALSMREAIFDIASALAAGDSPASFDLQIIRRMAANAVAAGELVYEGEGFRWTWDDAGRSLERPLWPIADSAVQLLTRRDLSRLRVCAADDCDWLFLDETRNRSRKWCDMNTCGNRAKVARYRERRE